MIRGDKLVLSSGNLGKKSVYFFWDPRSAGYLAPTPIKPVLRRKRRFVAFQNIQNFEDRSCTARVILILVRRLRNF